MKLLKVFFFLAPVLVFSQEFEIEGSLQTTAILSNESENPFWFHTNSNYSVGEFSTISATGALNATYAFSKFDLNAGVSIFARDGVEESVQRKDLYVQFENSWLRATLGSKSQTVVADGLSSTNKNFLWSGNARPIPGLLLEANNPIKINDMFGVDWGIAHYQLNDNRFVDGTRLHYKRLGLITTFNENHKLTAKVQHYAEWGGTSPVYGKLRNGFKDFIQIFFASNTAEIGLEGERLNALGNHLGSYMLDYEFKINVGEFSVYHEHPFEDGSGTALANFPDGVWGVFFKPKDQSLFSSFLYEYIDTVDQSGIAQASGFDGYFGNTIYRSGWSYEQNVIGLPFILYDKNIEVTADSKPYISNRSKVHHIGFSGNIDRFEWKLKTTIAKYLGSYKNPFDPELKYWYNYASVAYKTDEFGTFTIMGGVDSSNLRSTVAGGGLTYSYTF